MKLLFITALLSLFLSGSILAEPSEFLIEKSDKRHSRERHIRAVHDVMKTSTTNIHKIRYQILEGMLNTRGYRWLFDGEGDGYILARFTYRGDTNVMRIEYNQSLVQLKYHDGIGDLVCQMNVKGICLRNNRGYFNYFKNLRNSINIQLSKGEEQ